jgi:hypothetical protein
MCIISKEVKFCTCSTLVQEELDHYWVLYRPQKHQPTFLVGEIASTENWNLFRTETIESILLKQLNNPLAFDQVYQFQEGDVFAICLNNLMPTAERMEFSFVFEEGSWIVEQFPVIPKFKYKQKASGKVFDVQLPNSKGLVE